MDKKSKEKKNTYKIIILAITILSIVIATILVLIFYSRSSSKSKYDNIDNYDYINIPKEESIINGISFSDFKYKSANDSQVFFLKCKNTTKYDIVGDRKYQITFYDEAEFTNTNEVFSIIDLKAGEERIISISLTNILNKISEFYMYE